MMTTETSGRSELTTWLAVDAAVITTFWIGLGAVAGLCSAAGTLAVTAALFLGRPRVGASRVAAGLGDERERGLYERANSVTATVLWAVITPWLAGDRRARRTERHPADPRDRALDQVPRLVDRPRPPVMSG